MLVTLYRPSLSLLTDLYQLTMAQAGFKLGLAEREAVFSLHFRKHPFAGGYTVAAGLSEALEWLSLFAPDQDDLTYLAGLPSAGGGRLFSPPFLDWLSAQRLSLDIDAVPEGRVVFPHEPVVRVRGPLWQGQLVETALLTIINFQSLIATKAARICAAAQGDAVVDFGLRRAQGVDGSLSATRAAYIGGVAATSNTLAGRLLGIPVRGTHAHSWVMSFRDEQEAFSAYAAAMPDDTLLLVDTYDTLDGVRKAVRVGLELRRSGHRLLGIRLDSGDLAFLSRQARAMLDEAGLHDASIVASNDLDEHTIESLKGQGARIDTWGVGTRLITAHDQPALGGVYKLTALREADGWRPVVKASEHTAKASVPGVLAVRRFSRDGQFIGDMIHDETDPATTESAVIVHPAEPLRRRALAGPSEPLLKPVMRAGTIVPDFNRDASSLAAARARCADDLARLDPACRRLLNPHEYPAGLELSLHDRRTRMILDARGRTTMEAM